MTVRRLTSVVSLAAVVAIAGGSSASARPERALARVKFVADYQATETGRFHDWHDLDLRYCSGDDETGTFSASVRPASALAFTVAPEFARGGPLLINWGKPSTGTISVTENGQGWIMASSGGCKQRTLDASGCGTYTKRDVVQLAATDPQWEFHWPKHVYLNWVADWPFDRQCPIGNFSQSWEQPTAKLSLTQLYRCGVRKGRRCKFRVGASHDFVWRGSQNHENWDDTLHVEWSITFRTIRKS
jgi:hypothetical protein